MTWHFGGIDHRLWNWTLAGLGYITPELAQKELDNYGCAFSLDLQLQKYNGIVKDTLNFQQFIKGKNFSEIIRSSGL